MLPEKLSTDLTSLREGQERLAIVIEMVVAPNGAITGSNVYRAVVLNRAKLAYNGVAAWLEGRGPVPQRLAAVVGLDEQLPPPDRVGQAVKNLRPQHRALSPEAPEAPGAFRGDGLGRLG